MNGYRTYICAGLGIIILGLNAAGVINDDHAKMLMEFLGFGGLAALRAALGK